jgi:hypothetical protein
MAAGSVVAALLLDEVDAGVVGLVAVLLVVGVITIKVLVFIDPFGGF